jgi:hypothetical protein
MFKLVAYCYPGNPLNVHLRGLLKLFLNPPTTYLSRFVSTYATADDDSVDESQLGANLGDGSVEERALGRLIFSPPRG